MPWSRLRIWKWVPGIFPGVKAAGAYGWRPTTLVVPNLTKIRGLNLPRIPWATSARCGMTWPYQGKSWRTWLDSLYSSRESKSWIQCKCPTKCGDGSKSEVMWQTEKNTVDFTWDSMVSSLIFNQESHRIKSRNADLFTHWKIKSFQINDSHEYAMHGE